LLIWNTAFLWTGEPESARTGFAARSRRNGRRRSHSATDAVPIRYPQRPRVNRMAEQHLEEAIGVHEQI